MITWERGGNRFVESAPVRHRVCKLSAFLPVRKVCCQCGIKLNHSSQHPKTGTFTFTHPTGLGFVRLTDSSREEMIQTSLADWIFSIDGRRAVSGFSTGVQWPSVCDRHVRWIDWPCVSSESTKAGILCLRILIGLLWRIRAAELDRRIPGVH